MGLREGARAFVVDPPAASWLAIDAPPLDVADELDGLFDYIHLFTRGAVELERELPRLRPHLGSTGSLWVSWPKGRKQGTDLTLPRVIEIGYRHVLVESTCLSVDATWSALKFTRPKPGKVYRNSYGRLPDRWGDASTGTSGDRDGD
ncbi:hypothetical protein ER308_10130 [Egibacter rhizosphaerae]|uniref:DUF3052 family protein n=2 Tax=Egibacter rhizosphaerae TaxID=1670831 RepID=A0A411YLD2_9ACTN|nr:hypothetical protein ER308_10130 [Egibacter rhizosphaerae]